MLVTTVVLAIPVSRYLAWIMSGEYKALRVLRWFEERLDLGDQNWKQYTIGLLVFNALLFSYSYLVMFIQPWTPLNELHRGMPAPTTIFNSVTSFMTNGGGFFGANSAHPYENPSAWTNFITCLSMMLFPFSLVLMFGRMLKKIRHSIVIYAVMLTLMVGMIAWAIYFELQPNPGLTAHPTSVTYRIASATAKGGFRELAIPAVAGLPLEQHLGNLEGKEMRFGTVAGPTFAALTTVVTCGAVNCAHDSLNPLTGLSAMVGMWLNCVFGGKGVGMINLLLFLIIGVFIAGQMVGRSPEYLGRKVGAREVKLAVIALLVHPLMILGATGLFAATSWGTKAEFNPAAHGFSEVTYQFSSASANNGSGFEGLGDTWGFNANPSPAPTSQALDVSAGLVMLFSRYLPIVAPIAMAAFLGMKKESPYGLGTMRDDTMTFYWLLPGTIVVIGALLFLPVASLGPLADHLGPMPFGGLFGEKFVNVIQVNLALKGHYGEPK